MQGVLDMKQEGIEEGTEKERIPHLIETVCKISSYDQDCNTELRLTVTGINRLLTSLLISGIMSLC